MIAIDKATWRGDPDDHPFYVYEIEGELFLLYKDPKQEEINNRHLGSGPFIQNFGNGKFFYTNKKTGKGGGCYISV